MGILRIVSIIFFAQGFAFGQITGNPNVKDLKAVVLDSTTTQRLIGKWSWLWFEESRRENERVIDKDCSSIGVRSDGTILVEECWEGQSCFSYKGKWRISQNNVIEIAFAKVFRNSKLEGPWVIYTLTSDEMTIVRILTSTGDWQVKNVFHK